MNRRQALICLTGAAVSRSFGFTAGTSRAVSRERALMGTRFSITCHHDSPALIEEAMNAAFAEGDRINNCASDYIADSELLSLTKSAAGTAVPVSELLFGLLDEAFFYARKTDGLFDPTIGPLTRLWRESRRRSAMPDGETLSRAKAAVGWQHVELDATSRTIRFGVPGMRLDLGGIAKGQTADRMLKILLQYGIPSSAVTAGGDVRLGDPPPDEKGWKVGVRNFDKLRDAEELLLADCAVSTSGDLQQSIEIGGVHYAHIIDPATGLGLTRTIAATVIAPDATMSDALDAACCIAPENVAKKMAADLGATLHCRREL